MLNESFGFENGIDTIIFSFIKITSFLYFVYKILASTKKSFSFEYVKLLRILLVITIISFALGSVSLKQLIVFCLSVFYPIGIFYIILDNFNTSNTKKILYFLLINISIQFIYSVIVNFSGFSNGLIIDDYFNGFFYEPRAYHFSVFVISSVILITIGITTFNIIDPKYKIFIFFLLITPIIAGAGRVVFSVVIAVALTLFWNIKGSATRKILYILLSIIIIFSFQYYASYYSTTQEVYEEFLNDPTNNLKIFYFLQTLQPFIDNPNLLLFGKGPGGYMSSSAMQFNPILVYKFNDSLHDLLKSDVYQGFNNIIGFVGDVGVFFICIYYYLVYKIYAKIIYLNGRNILITIFFIFTFLFSFLFHIFDDPYYSMTIWMFLGVALKIAQIKSLSAKN